MCRKLRYTVGEMAARTKLGKNNRCQLTQRKPRNYRFFPTSDLLWDYYVVMYDGPTELFLWLRPCIVVTIDSISFTWLIMCLKAIFVTNQYTVPESVQRGDFRVEIVFVLAIHHCVRISCVLQAKYMSKLINFLSICLKRFFLSGCLESKSLAYPSYLTNCTLMLDL